MRISRQYVKNNVVTSDYGMWNVIAVKPHEDWLNAHNWCNDVALVRTVLTNEGWTIGDIVGGKLLISVTILLVGFLELT